MNAHRQLAVTLACLLTGPVSGQSAATSQATLYKGMLEELVNRDFSRARQEYERAATGAGLATRQIALARLIELDRLELRHKSAARHQQALRTISQVKFANDRRNRIELRTRLKAALAKDSAADQKQIDELRRQLLRMAASVRGIVTRVLAETSTTGQPAAQTRKAPRGRRTRSLRRMAAVIANRHLDGKTESANELAKVLRRSTGRRLSPVRRPDGADPKRMVRRSSKEIAKYLQDRTMPVYERQVVTSLQQRVVALSADGKAEEAVSLLLRLPYYNRLFLR